MLFIINFIINILPTGFNCARFKYKHREHYCPLVLPDIRDQLTAKRRFLKHNIDFPLFQSHLTGYNILFRGSGFETVIF